MTIDLPAGAMAVLVGVSGSGKSTFAARHFRPTEILSSDAMRAIVADDPADQSATEAAFELLHTALALRLASRRLTVVDATNVEAWARGRLLAIARRHGRPAVAVVMDTPLATCARRNAARGDHQVPDAAVVRQARLLERSIDGLEGEGFTAVHVVTPEIADDVVIRRG